MGTIVPGQFKVRFRAAVAEDLLKRLASDYGVQAYVEICPPIPYREALTEMLSADGLLVMQATNCNAQIPAKVYEYLRAGRPILCLFDPIGDTAGVMRAAGIDAIAKLDGSADIAGLLTRFLNRTGPVLSVLGDASFICSASRRGRTEALAKILDDITGAAKRS